MSYTYEELKHKTVAQLREIAAESNTKPSKALHSLIRSTCSRLSARH
jgi:hypothetical protein